MSCEGTMYRIAETYHIIGSVLKKKIQYLVLFMDITWFLVYQKCNWPKFRCWCCENPHAFIDVSLNDLKVQEVRENYGIHTCTVTNFEP